MRPPAAPVRVGASRATLDRGHAAQLTQVVPARGVKCVRRLALLPTHVGVGVVLLMADRKGRDAVTGEIKGMQIKDERAVEAGAVPTPS